MSKTTSGTISISINKRAVQVTLEAIETKAGRSNKFQASFKINKKSYQFIVDPDSDIYQELYTSSPQEYFTKMATLAIDIAEPKEREEKHQVQLSGADVMDEYDYNELINRLIFSDDSTESGIALVKQYNIKTKSENGDTLLMAALSARKPEVAGYLIDNGVEIDAHRKDGLTALIIAVRWGLSEMVRILVANRVDLDSKYESNTALMYAASGGNLGAVQILVAAGANADIQNKYGDTALINILKKDQRIPNLVEMVEILLTEENINLLDTEGRNALFYAVSRGYVDVAQTLLANRADPNIADQYRTTPLLEAVNEPEMSEILIAHGADVNAKDSLGDTALSLSARHNHERTVAALVKAGANVNSTNKRGQTALIEASKTGNLNIVKLLIANGAYVNAVEVEVTRARRGFDERFISALEYAREREHNATANYLQGCTAIVGDLNKLLSSENLTAETFNSKLSAIIAVAAETLRGEYKDEGKENTQQTQNAIAALISRMALDENGNNLGHKLALKNRFDLVEGLISRGVLKADIPNSAGETVKMMLDLHDQASSKLTNFEFKDTNKTLDENLSDMVAGFLDNKDKEAVLKPKPPKDKPKDPSGKEVNDKNKKDQKGI